MTIAALGIILLSFADTSGPTTSVKPIDGDAIRIVDAVGSSPDTNRSSINVELRYDYSFTYSPSTKVDPVQSSVKPIDEKVTPVGSSGPNKKRPLYWKKTEGGVTTTYRIRQIEVGVVTGRVDNTDRLVRELRNGRIVDFSDASDFPTKSNFQFNNIRGRDVSRLVIKISLSSFADNQPLPDEQSEYIIQKLEFRDSTKQFFNSDKTERPNKKPLD